MNAHLSGNRGVTTLKDLTKIVLRRDGGAAFKIEIYHPTGAIERVLDDTSGKLDNITITTVEGQTVVYISGKGIKREGGHGR